MSLRFERDGKWFRELLDDTESDAFVLDRADVTCAVRKMRENVFVEGDIESVAKMPCSRCLETTGLSLRSSFHYTFAPPPLAQSEDAELSATDLDFAYYDGDFIDLDGAVFEQILLQIPIKPLCGESCRGLCHHCGVNLNSASCKCGDQHFDERLAILKEFKVQP